MDGKRARRQELPAPVVQPAETADQPAALHGGGGGAAPAGAPRPRQSVGAYLPPLPGRTDIAVKNH